MGYKLLRVVDSYSPRLRYLGYDRLYTYSHDMEHLVMCLNTEVPSSNVFEHRSAQE